MGLSHEDKSQFDKSFSRPWLTVVNYIFEHLVQLSVSRHLNSIMWKVVLTACYSLIQIPSRMRAKDMLGLDIHGQLICPGGLQVIVRDSRASCLLAPYLKFIDSDPTIRRKSLEHWDKELEAAGPVADQEHHTDQVEDPHEHRGHVQELKNRVRSQRVFRILKRFKKMKIPLVGSSGRGCNIKRANKTKMNLWNKIS